jgi:hypothetical protein
MNFHSSRKTTGEAKKTPTRSASLNRTMNASTGEVKTSSGLPMPSWSCACVQAAMSGRAISAKRYWRKA